MQCRNKQDQRGFVSIFTVMIIMSVLTLVAIGFSGIVRQAERRTLDNQLNLQAFYAAESGVNDARRIIDAYVRTNPTSNFDKDSCDGQLAGQNLAYTVDATTNVGYTCVLVDSDPFSIQADSVPPVGTGEPFITSFSTANIISGFTFQWDSDDPTATAPASALTAGSPTLPTATVWGNSIGILRVDLVPLDVTDSLSRQNLVNNGYTFFLYPTSLSGVNTLNTDGNPGINVLNGTNDKAGTSVTQCNNTGYRCRATILLGSTAGALTARRYMVRLQALYNPIKVDFSPFDAVRAAQRMQGGQAVVDVTGKANDVYRRIRTVVPLNVIPGEHPALALLSANSVCKRLSAIAGNTQPDFTGINLTPGENTEACNTVL
jgi:hypothetical protein